MTSDPRIRPKISVLLSNKSEAIDAVEIVKTWKDCREAANHLIRAIRLYAALLKGDAGLLQEFFPQFGAFVAPARPKLPTTPAPIVQRNETEDLADLLDVFGGELEF